MGAGPTEQRIYEFAPNGTLIGKYGAGNLGQPMDVAFRGRLIYVADQGRNRIAVFDTNGAFQGAFGSKGTGNLGFNRARRGWRSTRRAGSTWPTR